MTPHPLTLHVELEEQLLADSLGHRFGLAPPARFGLGAGRVLDIGTGTGAWAAEFARANPGVDVVAIDLAPTWTEM